MSEVVESGVAEAAEGVAQPMVTEETAPAAEELMKIEEVTTPAKYETYYLCSCVMI